MRLRQHRGTFAESCATAVVIEQSHEAVVGAVCEALKPYNGFENGITAAQVHAHRYCYDSRTDGNGDVWGDTFIVTVDGYGVFGFTDADPNASTRMSIDTTIKHDQE